MMTKEMTFEKFRNLLLYKQIVEWNKEENYIVLDNSMKVTIEMTDSDCCALAYGEFKNVKLNAVITDVTEPKYESWQSDWGEYGCSAVVKMLHNQNLVCQVNADADAGNGGYYFSVASFIVNFKDEKYSVYLVGSEDGSDE